MSKQAKTLVPKLRFPEFRDVSVWEYKKLEDICIKISQGGTPDTTIPEYWNGDIEWLTPAEMGKLDTRFINETNRKITKAGLKNCSSDLLPIDSVILSTRAPIGHLLINKVEMAINQGCKALVPLVSTDCNFLYYSLVNSRKKLSDLGAGNTFKELSGSALKSFSINIPRLPEQQKIADFLSSLDDLITAQNQKVEALKQHKKGLLQQLFPVEGETVPKLRFPEFENDGEWVLEEFSKYIVLYRGSSPRPIQSYLTSDSNGINWIKIGDTKNAKNSVLSQVEERITPEGAKHSRKVTIGELILANSMSYGKTYEVAIEGCIYDGWFVLREYENHFDKQFLLQLLNSEYMQNQYQKLSAGGIVQNISSDIVYKTILPCTSLKEQKKIANLLSSIDELITTETQQLEAYKTHKKGLMQQLFPSLDEVDA